MYCSAAPVMEAHRVYGYSDLTSHYLYLKYCPILSLFTNILILKVNFYNKFS